MVKSQVQRIILLLLIHYQKHIQVLIMYVLLMLQRQIIGQIFLNQTTTTITIGVYDYGNKAASGFHYICYGY